MKKGMEDTGKFWHHGGQELPWQRDFVVRGLLLLHINILSRQDLLPIHLRCHPQLRADMFTDRRIEAGIAWPPAPAAVGSLPSITPNSASWLTRTGRPRR